MVEIWLCNTNNKVIKTVDIKYDIENIQIRPHEIAIISKDRTDPKNVVTHANVFKREIKEFEQVV